MKDFEKVKNSQVYSTFFHLSIQIDL